MRILLINSNTNQDVTAHIKAEAIRFAGPETEIDAANAAFGPDIIATRTEAAISQHALLDACARFDGQADAIIVGMSLDAGVWAAREMMDVPVVGMSEAALHMASLCGNRIGLFVFGGVTQTYREMAESYGYGGRLGTVEALGITPKQHLSDPELVEKRIIQRCEALAEDGTIDSVILVGAVAAGLPRKLRDRLPIPAFEGISCAVLMAEALVRLQVSNPRLGSFARPNNRASKKLDDKLTDLLARD